MRVTTAEEAHEAGARRALLERLASGLAVLAAAPALDWTCCWLSYTGPGGVGWVWQRCAGTMPGGLPRWPDGGYAHCGHWHHQHEVFIA